jgi:hypothetical protein
MYPVKVRKAIIQAMRSYQLQSYPGRIAVFAASESPVKVYA